MILTELPLDPLEYIYQLLDSELLLNLRKLDRTSYGLSSDILFRRVDEESFKYQTRLIEFFRLTGFSTLIDAKLFAKWIKNPNTTALNRLAGLLTIAEHQQVDLKISDAMLSLFKNNPKASAIPYLPLLAIIAHKLSQTQILSILKFIENKEAREEDFSIKCQVYISLFPVLSVEKRKEVLEFFDRALYNSQSRSIALHAFSLFTSNASRDECLQIKDFIIKFHNEVPRINDNNYPNDVYYICYKLCKRLSFDDSIDLFNFCYERVYNKLLLQKLVKDLDRNAVNRLLNDALTESINPDFKIRKRSHVTFLSLVDKMDLNDAKRCLNLVVFTDAFFNDYDHRFPLWTFPHFDGRFAKDLFDTVFPHVTGSHARKAKYAVTFLIYVAEFLSEPQTNKLIQEMDNKLIEEHIHVIKKPQIIASLNAQNLKKIVSVITSEISMTNYVTATAIQIIETMLPKLNQPLINTLFDFAIRHQKIELVQAIAPRLNGSQITRSINFFKNIATITDQAKLIFKHNNFKLAAYPHDEHLAIQIFHNCLDQIQAYKYIAPPDVDHYANYMVTYRENFSTAQIELIYDELMRQLVAGYNFATIANITYLYKIFSKAERDKMNPLIADYIIDHFSPNIDDLTTFELLFDDFNKKSKNDFLTKIINHLAEWFTNGDSSFVKFLLERSRFLDVNHINKLIPILVTLISDDKRPEKLTNESLNLIKRLARECQGEQIQLLLKHIIVEPMNDKKVDVIVYLLINGKCDLNNAHPQNMNNIPVINLCNQLIQHPKIKPVLQNEMQYLGVFQDRIQPTSVDQIKSDVARSSPKHFR